MGRLLVGGWVILALAGSAACKAGPSTQERARKASERIRPDPARQGEEDDRLVAEHLKQAATAEARSWLADPTHDVGGSKERVLSLVEELHRSGATQVHVTDVATRDGRTRAGSLVVELPGDPAARAKALAVVGAFRQARGESAPKEVGQRYALLTLE